MKNRLVSILKSPKKDEMYLYVDKKQGMEMVPASLLEVFGKPAPVFDLLLSEAKKLARADAVEVLKAIEEKGFYLQMPPAPEPEVLEVIKAREMSPAVGRAIEE